MVNEAIHPMALSDYELLLNVATDDRALAEMIQRHGNLLAVIILRIAGNEATPADIEEAVADCFIAAWKGAATFDPARGSVIGWLTHLARYEALTLRRHLRRRSREHIVSDAQLGQIPDERATASMDQTVDQLASRALIESLVPILEAISNRDVEILNQRFNQERSAQEIATALNITANAVRISISRALAKLRLRLESDAGANEDLRTRLQQGTTPEHEKET